MNATGQYGGITMSKPAKITIIIIITAILLFLGYIIIDKWHRQEVEKAVQKKEVELKKKIEEEKTKIADLKKELSLHKDPEVSKEKIEDALGKTETPVPSTEDRLGCEEIDGLILSFFGYLDQREYIQEMDLSGDVKEEFKKSVGLLSTRLPRISGEMDDPITLIHNIAHLYRALGKRRIIMFKMIMENEHDILESIMSSFYLWGTAYNECDDRINGRPSMNVLYEYSCFFLNSLGGRSYLSRRDSKIRTLIRYYCIRIVDSANDAKINSNGMDIRPHLLLLDKDMHLQRGLIHQKLYIDELQLLKQKYTR